MIIIKSSSSSQHSYTYIHTHTHKLALGIPLIKIFFWHLFVHTYNLRLQWKKKWIEQYWHNFCSFFRPFFDFHICTHTHVCIGEAKTWHVTCNFCLFVNVSCWLSVFCDDWWWIWMENINKLCVCVYTYTWKTEVEKCMFLTASRLSQNWITIGV